MCFPAKLCGAKLCGAKLSFDQLLPLPLMPRVVGDVLIDEPLGELHLHR
jgi:hypothetical protein